MYNNTRKQPTEPFHDFMVERKWMVTAVGFGQSKSWLYTFYVTFIFVYLYSHLVLNLYGTILAFGEKSLIPHALHVILVLLFSIWAITTRVLTDKAMNRVRKYLQSGCYLYENENLLEEQVNIKESVVQDIRKKSRDFASVWVPAGFSICILFPVIQVFVVSNEEYEKVVEIANPYLPAFFYMPFNTRNIWGFIAAYIFAVIVYFYTLGYGIIMNEFYISMLLQLRAQLRILNYSIRCIHKRATLMYARLRKIPPKEIPLHDVYLDPDYQKCIVTCLRSNIQHHQLLLRFNKDFIKFGGSLLLLFFNIAGMVFALNLYVVIQNPSLNTSIKSFINLFAEQLYVIYMCVFGEIIMKESSSLFRSLYSIPWFYYNKSFNQMLRVFMFFTMKPMTVKTPLIDFTASLETYANKSRRLGRGRLNCRFISAMYKILNILKQSDAL